MYIASCTDHLAETIILALVLFEYRFKQKVAIKTKKLFTINAVDVKYYLINVWELTIDFK